MDPIAPLSESKSIATNQQGKRTRAKTESVLSSGSTLWTPFTAPVTAPIMVEKETCTSDLYDYIIFYRWRSPYDMYERGQVMARLVAEIIGKECHRVWLDQREMQRSTPPEQVIWKIANIFPRVSQVIILAAPGDWLRFANNDDIHRWEWELSLQSDKKIWLLQYGQHEQTTPFSQQDLVTGFGVYHPRLAELASKKFVSVRVVTMENIDGVIREITTSLLDDS